MNDIKAGDTILVEIPRLKLPLVKVTVKAVTNLPGKMIAVELPEPISHHNCDGACKPKQGWWCTPANVINARSEEEAKKMLEEAARLQEAQKPKPMKLVAKNGQYQLVDAA